MVDNVSGWTESSQPKWDDSSSPSVAASCSVLRPGNSDSVDAALAEVISLLDQFEGEEFFKRLFWEILSYERIRDPLPQKILSPHIAGVVSHLEVFAACESLTVALVKMRQLPEGGQLEQMAHALRRHLSNCVVILNHATSWAIVHPDDRAMPRVRFLPLPGPAAQRPETARALLALSSHDDLNESLTRLEQSDRLDVFFPGVLPNLGDVFNDFDRIAKHKDPEVQALRPFLRAISVYPLLTAEQERGEDIWCGDAPTVDQLRFQQERLVLYNLRLVVWMAFKVNRMAITLGDLVQEGTFGLMTAAQRFEPQRGNRFTTYAFYWVRQAMYRALHNQCNLIRWPVHVASKLIQAARTKQLGDLTAGEKPVLYVPDRLDRASFYETDPDASVIKAEIATGVRTALSPLRPDIRRVLESRFGLNGEEETLESIGETMNLTRERIRQIEAAGFRKLRHATRSERLRPFHELSGWREYNRYDDGVNGRYRAPFRNYVRAREGF